MCSEDIQHIFTFGEDQVRSSMRGILWHKHKGLGGCNFAMSYSFDGSYPDGMVGILSSLQDIALEGSDNTYKGTKYVAFLTELNNKLCALNDVNSIYL